MAYTFDYDGETPEFIGDERDEQGQRIRYVERSRRRFEIPAILKTSAAFLLGAAALFSAEIWGPEWMMPSTPMGMYEARIEEEVKAAELRVQGRFESWSILYKAAADQRLSNTKPSLRVLSRLIRVVSSARKPTRRFQGSCNRSSWARKLTD